MKEQEIFTKKASEGYIVCQVGQCPLREQCLRWKVGEQMPDSVRYVTLVNPRLQGVGANGCPEFREARKVRFAKGMLGIFTGDMPRRVEPAVRQAIISQTCRTYYYEYRKGQRLIPPALQQVICEAFRREGWSGEVKFDSYIEDYDW